MRLAGPLTLRPATLAWLAALAALVLLAGGAQAGTVQVDVELVGDLPAGARPDLSVDGTIELERLVDALYVGRPAFGQADSEVRLFKLDADDVATRVPVQFGRSSVNQIEIRSGLNVGDRIILSDTSAYDQHDRIRLE